MMAAGGSAEGQRRGRPHQKAVTHCVPYRLSPVKRFPHTLVDQRPIGHHPGKAHCAQLIGHYGWHPRDHGNVQNMSGIDTTEVGKGLGFTMQNANKGAPLQAGGSGASNETKPYTQD